MCLLGELICFDILGLWSILGYLFFMFLGVCLVCGIFYFIYFFQLFLDNKNIAQIIVLGRYGGPKKSL